jgi:hypothetical protein
MSPLLSALETAGGDLQQGGLIRVGRQGAIHGSFRHRQVFFQMQR